LTLRLDSTPADMIGVAGSRTGRTTRDNSIAKLTDRKGSMAETPRLVGHATV
jgi:hypothetical protein